MRGARVRPFIPYDIPLGDGDYARLVLPQDMSEEEAGRICGVIRTLAFPGEVLAAARAERERASRSLGALMADWAAVADAPDVPARKPAQSPHGTSVD